MTNTNSGAGTWVFAPNKNQFVRLTKLEAFVHNHMHSTWSQLANLAGTTAGTMERAYDRLSAKMGWR